MFSLADPSAEKAFNRFFLFLFICLFLVAPLYYQDNPGGEGLFLPFNNTVWIAATFVIALGLLRVVHTQRLSIPWLTAPLLVFPLSVFVLGALFSVALPVSWMFRSLSLWGGVLLFLSLNQFRLERRWQDNLLLVIAASSLIQALIGLCHLTLDHNLWGYIPNSPGVARGIFQQPNLEASYLVTGLLVAFYFLSLPSFTMRSIPLKALIFTTIGFNSLIIATSGSRVGLLGLVLGMLFLISARYRQLWKRPGVLGIAILAMVLGGLASNLVESNSGGFARSLEKMDKLTRTVEDPTQNDARLMIYHSSLELLMEKPVLGHGIGRFQPVWADKKAEYLKEHPEAAILVPRLSHPHNELLFWGIEGGLVVIAGILLAAAALLYQIWQLGWQRGGAYLALLTPIGLHTQVELPFYISQLHWLLFLTLVALVASHRRRTYAFSLSRFGRASGLAVAMSLPVMATIFFSHALLANRANMSFQVSPTKDIRQLEISSRNIYFAENTAFMRMQTLLRWGLDNDNEEALRAYVSWAREHLKSIPDNAVYVGLAMAYHKLGEFQQAYAVMDRNLAIYPEGQLAETGKAALNEMDRSRGRQPRYPQ